MAKPLKKMIRKAFLAKEQNLLSLDDPYEVMAKLLRSREVTSVVDAGASNGRISRRLLKLFPQATVYGFEPNPLYGDDLTRLSKRECRFKPQFLAVSHEEGIVDMHLTVSPGNSSLFVPSDRLKELDPAGTSLRETRRIPSVTLDQWALGQDVAGVEVMKLDIQGGELQALRGAHQMLRDSVILVYTEILFNPIYEGGALYSEIDLCLRDCGFVLHDIFKPKYGPKGTLLWGNAMYLHPEHMGH
jgi:FkbM family methyltransferase